MKEKAEYLREKLNRGELVVGGHAFFTDPAVTSLLAIIPFKFYKLRGDRLSEIRAEMKLRREQLSQHETTGGEAE